jgi:alpha/beta superfamily hydrolase
MHNKVVYRLARGLRKSGCVVLRFNFRGVNLSEGVYDHGKGEVEDAREAFRELRGRYPHLPALIAGFSFGSRVALRIAASEPDARRVIAVGFPTKYPNREYVREVRAPKFFIQSTHDEHGPQDEMQKFFETLPDPKQLSWVEAADHFFRDSLDAYEAEVVRVGNSR